MRYRITDRPTMKRKLNAEAGYYIDSEVNPSVRYALAGDEIAVVNLDNLTAYRLTLEEAREGAGEMRDTPARTELQDVIDIAEFRRNIRLE